MNSTTLRGAFLALAGLALCAAAQPGRAKDEPAREPLWARQCAEAAEGKKDVCMVQQFVTAQPGNRQLLLAQFSYGGPDGKPQLILSAPLGILLTGGLTFSIDGKKSLTVPFELCNTGGCLSIIDMDAPALEQFRKGKVLTVRYLAGDKRPLDLPVRLEGLDAALKSIAP